MPRTFTLSTLQRAILADLEPSTAGHSTYRDSERLLRNVQGAYDLHDPHKEFDRITHAEFRLAIRGLLRQKLILFEKDWHGTRYYLNHEHPSAS